MTIIKESQTGTRNYLDIISSQTNKLLSVSVVIKPHIDVTGTTYPSRVTRRPFLIVPYLPRNARLHL